MNKFKNKSLLYAKKVVTSTLFERDKENKIHLVLSIWKMTDKYDIGGGGNLF